MQGNGQKFANPHEFVQGQTMALSHESAQFARNTSLAGREAASSESEHSSSEALFDSPQHPEFGSSDSVPDRRASGKRLRARDRVMDRANQRSFSKTGSSKKEERSSHLENMLLFIDDDLRETALAVARIEQFLVGALAVLERPGLPRKEVSAMANNTEVLNHLDDLNSTVESLRRRMAQLASTLKS